VRLVPKLCCLLVVTASLGAALAAAQEGKLTEEKSIEEKSTDAPAPAVTQAESPRADIPWLSDDATRPTAPDVFLLPDEFGKLRKVLGFRYEDFFQAWQRDAADTVAAPPRYVIDAATVTGKVVETHAELRLEFTIETTVDGWVEVPLQLPSLILQEVTIDNKADGECLIYDPKQRGYVVWLSATAGESRTVVLDGLVKVTSNSANAGIEFHLPRATKATASVRLPGADSRIEASPELVVSTMPMGSDSTEVRLSGQASPWRLNWRVADATSIDEKAVLEVNAQTNVLIDRRRATYTAALEIDASGMPVQQIQLRLPQQAKLAARQPLASGQPLSYTNDYEVVADSTGAASTDQQVVTLRRTQPGAGPWKIRLAAEQPLRSFADATECRIEGFEVLGAFQQSGTVTLKVDEHLQAYFDTHGEIDQIPTPDNGTADEGHTVLGSFRYTRFPWRLLVVTSPRQRRISVKPRYQLQLSSEQAQLDAQFEYQFTGAKVYSLRINLHGWERTDVPIESGGLVDRDRVVEATRDGFLVLPLVNPEAQQLRVNLSFRRATTLGPTRLPMPEPQGAFVVDGELSVTSAEAVRVEPLLAELEGLGVISTPDEVTPGRNNGKQIADSQHAAGKPLRLRSFLPQPVFAANLSLKQREVSARVLSQVELDAEQIQVRQQLDYQSKYRAVSQLSLDVPNQMWQNDSLTVSLDGESLPLGLSTYVGEEPTDETPDVPDSDETYLRHVLVSLPRPMQNEIPLELSYTVAAPKMPAGELRTVSLPLATPADPVLDHRCVLTATAPAQVSIDDHLATDAWQPIEGVSGDDDASEEKPAARTVELRTDQSVNGVTFHAQVEATSQQSQPATLERSWIQSWLSANTRQVRAAFRFRTPHPRVFATVPGNLTKPQIEVLLDGAPREFEVTGGGRLSVPLPSNGQRVSHTLEVRYQLPSALPTWGEITMSPPRLESNATHASVYWQLVLPRGWHAQQVPAALTPDYWLGWKNYRWGRQPTLTQADLETITDAVIAPAPPPLSTQYVYRAFEIPPQFSVIVIRQVWLFLLGTLATFAVGMLWLYTSVARTGAFWLVVACALLAANFRFPEITMLVIQALLAGGLMTYIAHLLRRTFSAGDDATPTPIRPSHESSISLTQSWKPHHLGSDAESAQTTAVMRPTGPPS